MRILLKVNFTVADSEDMKSIELRTGHNDDISDDEGNWSSNSRTRGDA